MDRNQKEQRVQKADGKVFNIADFTKNVRYQSQDYIFQQGDGSLTPTGHLVIFRLERISGEPLSFVARWDGGSREPGKSKFELDIDMCSKEKDEVKKFIGGQAGYSGHHAIKKTDVSNCHCYEVLIKTPNDVVFEATVSFTVHRQLGVSLSTSNSPTVNLNVTKN
jgi:hypothetical protein